MAGGGAGSTLGAGVASGIMVVLEVETRDAPIHRYWLISVNLSHIGISLMKIEPIYLIPIRVLIPITNIIKLTIYLSVSQGSQRRESETLNLPRSYKCYELCTVQLNL